MRHTFSNISLGSWINDSLVYFAKNHIHAVQFPDLGFCQFSSGDVPEDPQHALDLTVRTPDRCFDCVDPGFFPGYHILFFYLLGLPGFPES